MTELPRPGPAPRHRPRRGFWKLFALPLVCSGAFVALLVGFGVSEGPSDSLGARLLEPLDRLAERSGLTLAQVSLTGARFTPDADIFDALDLDRARTLLTFDARRAQARIEALPWIESARLERMFPDRLVVHVVERQPFAVWADGARHYVVDRSGRTLAAVKGDAMPGLPRIGGSGAPQVAADFFAKLEQHPALHKLVRLAERRGDRRWSLHLASGAVVHLPAAGEADALARAGVLVASGLGARGEIDLRVAGRDVVRQEPGRATRAANLGPGGRS